MVTGSGVLRLVSNLLLLVVVVVLMGALIDWFPAGIPNYLILELSKILPSEIYEIKFQVRHL